MDPIRIPCSSCGGKLVIRSEKLLGQVVTCPRCKQFVQIPQAIQSDAVEAAPLDSQALTSVDLDAANPLHPNPSDQGSLPQSQAFTKEFEGVEAALASTASFRSIDLRSSESSELDLNIDSNVSVPNPRQVWQSTSSQNRQFYFLAGLAACVCVVSVGLLILFLSSFAKDNDTSVELAQAEPARAESDIPKPNDQASEVSAENQPADTKLDPTAISESSEDANPSKETNEVVMEGDANTTDDMAEEIPSAIESLLQSAGVENAEITSTSNNDTNSSADEVAKNNPLDLLLNPERSEKPTPPAADGGNSAEVEISPEIPEGFRDLAPVFDLGAGTTLPDAKILPAEEVDGGAAAAMQVDAASLYHPDPKPLPIWDELKHTKVISLEIPNLPFLEALNTVESIYGIPCDWDLEALRSCDVDLRTRVTHQFKDTTLEQVYSDLLNGVGLKLSAQSNQLPEIVPQNLDGLGLQQEIDLTPLITETATPELWLSTLIQLVAEADQKVSLNGQIIKFSADLPLKYRLELFDIVQEVSDAAKARLPSVPETVSVDNNGSELQTVFTLLNRKGTESFARRRPVALMLSKLAHDIELPLIVDWSECWNHGLVPTTSMVSLPKNRTLAQMSKFVLAEHSLVLIVDAHRRLVLTTSEVQHAIHSYQVIRLPESADLKTIRQTLVRLTPLSSSGRSELQIVPMPGALDSMAIVKICAPSIEQLSNDSLAAALGLNVTD